MKGEHRLTDRSLTNSLAMEKQTDLLELPMTLVTALKAYNFSGKPIWRIGEGLEHVKVELTYKLPTTDSFCVEQKESQNVNSKGKKTHVRGGRPNARASLHLPICLPTNLPPDNNQYVPARHHKDNYPTSGVAISRETNYTTSSTNEETTTSETTTKHLYYHRSAVSDSYI